MDSLLPAARAIGDLLKARGETVAVAESSAGGLIAASLLAVPGASAYFLGGAVTYTKAARAGLLGITDGTENYIATEDLMVAVNAAVTLERPLLVKGEPGTGKTVLAHEIAAALKLPMLTWHIKSTTKAQHGLYEYDAVSRLRDSQLGDAKVKDIANYIRPGKLWQAFTAEGRQVLLIDEIDKADIEFPNDLLLELDRMEFFVYETGETIKAEASPRGDHHVEQ
jgi:MoxR-like ATPase